MRITEYYNRFRMFDVPAVLTGDKLLVNLEKWYVSNNQLIKAPCETSIEALRTMLNTMGVATGYIPSAHLQNREGLSKELCYIYADKELECFASNVKGGYFFSLLKENWVVPYTDVWKSEDSSHFVWLKKQTPNRVLIKRAASTPDQTEDGVLRIEKKDTIRILSSILRTETVITFSPDIRSSWCTSTAYVVGNYLIVLSAWTTIMATHPTFFIIDLNTCRMTKAYTFTEVCIYKDRIDVWSEIQNDNIVLYRFPIMQSGAVASPNWMRYGTVFFKPIDIVMFGVHSSVVERDQRTILLGRGKSVVRTVYCRDTQAQSASTIVNNLVVDLANIRQIQKSYADLNKLWAYDDKGLLARARLDTSNDKKGILWDIIKKPEFKYASISKPFWGNNL